MSLRRLVVEADASSLNVSEFCSEHGISRWFFYDLRRRHAVEGDAVLEPKSRAPRRVANKTPVGVENEIVRVRKQLQDQGHDAGAESIWCELVGLEGLPSPSTVARILRRGGFIVPDPSKAPKHAHRRFTAERANECWQLDDTFWELADGATVKILNVVDDHSRLLVASTATLNSTGAFALSTLGQAATVLGWPERVLSDNAGPFRDVLGSALRALGVSPKHSRPYHPQTCGKVERFHQTLKQWLAKQPPAHTAEELQQHLDAYRQHYNHRRSHSSVGQRTPASVWATAPKSGPSAQPLGEPTSLYEGIVRESALWCGKRWRISVDRKHNGQHATAIITGLACHVFIEGRLVRHLPLDPTRTSQPLHPTMGRPLRSRQV